MARKNKSPEELENERLVRQAEEEHDIDFRWEYDVEAADEARYEGEEIEGREWFYCVATAPDGRRASLSGIEDPDPIYKTQVEADLARELGIEPEYLPPPEEEMHTMTGWDEARLLEGVEIPRARFFDSLREIESKHPDNVFLDTRGDQTYIRLHSRDAQSHLQIVAAHPHAAVHGDTLYIWKVKFHRLSDKTIFHRYLYEFDDILREHEELPASLEELIQRSDSYGPKIKAQAVADLAKTPELVAIYGEIAPIINFVPEEETMHEITGWDEAVIARYDEATTLSDTGPKLQVDQETWNGAVVWVKGNAEAGGYQAETTEYTQGNEIVLQFPFSKYPGQKGFRIKFNYYPPEYSGNNEVGINVRLGQARIVGVAKLHPDDTFRAILDRLVAGAWFGKAALKRALSLPEYPQVETAADQFIRLLNKVPEPEEMHEISGWDEARLNENVFSPADFEKLQAWAATTDGAVTAEIEEYHSGQTAYRVWLNSNGKAGGITVPGKGGRKYRFHFKICIDYNPQTRKVGYTVYILCGDKGCGVDYLSDNPTFLPTLNDIRKKLDWMASSGLDYRAALYQYARRAFAAIKDTDKFYFQKLDALYQKIIDLFNPVAEPEEMHEISGWDEAVEETIDLTALFRNTADYPRLAELLTQAGFQKVQVKEIVRTPTLFARGVSEISGRTGGGQPFARKFFGIVFAFAPDFLTIHPDYEDRSGATLEFKDRYIPVNQVPTALPARFIIENVQNPYIRSYKNEEAFAEFGKIYANFLHAITAPPAEEEMHEITGWDEARKRVIPTGDISGLFPDYDETKKVAARIKASGYFGEYDVLAYSGTLRVSKRWDFERRDKSVFGQDWWEQGFREVNLYLKIEYAGSRMKKVDYHGKVLRVEVNVDGKPSEKEKANRPSYFPSYYWHRKNSVFDGRKLPLAWPGPMLLAPSLDPEVRQRASDLCAEAYAAFIKGLFPPPPTEEEMHEITGWDEALLHRITAALVDANPLNY